MTTRTGCGTSSSPPVLAAPRPAAQEEGPERRTRATAAGQQQAAKGWQYLTQLSWASSAARIHECMVARCGHTTARRLGEWAGGALWCLETALPLLLAICCGACLGFFVEGMGALDSAYFSLISILTVGYGDLVPSTRLGRTLCTILLPLACAASLRSVSRLGAALDYSGKQQRLYEAAAAGDASDDARFQRMHQLLANAASNRKDGIITEADYLCST